MLNLEIEHGFMLIYYYLFVKMAWLKRKLAKRAAEKQNLRIYQFGSKRTMTQTELMTLSRELDESTGVGYVPGNDAAIQDAIDGALYIANHLRQEDEFKRVSWSAVRPICSLRTQKISNPVECFALPMSSPQAKIVAKLQFKPPCAQIFLKGSLMFF